MRPFSIPWHLTRIRRADTARRSSRRVSAGQSLAEFAILVPVLLLMVGMAIDFARLYQGWTNLESATRDAAQYLATSDVDPDANDYTVPGATANATNDAKALTIMNSEVGATFTRSGSATLGTCTQRTLTTVTSSTDPTRAAGGTTANPVQKVEVKTCMPFRTLFAYPFFTIDGNWILSSDRTYTVLVGR